MKKSVFVMLMAMGMLVLPAIAHAQEVNILVHKLVQKGILTQTEGQVILDQTKQEVAEGKTGLPKWVQNTKLTGSFRLRYQYDKKKNDTTAQNRERIRLLLGLKSKINDQFNVGVGLTTGGGNPHSRNQTLQDAFSQKSIYLDYAYGEWTPTDWFKMVGGKFKAEGSYLWITGTHMLWDDDFSMEGQSMQLHTNLMDNLEGFWNSGLWILGQNGDGKNNPRPFVYYNQLGLKGSYDKLDAALAGTYYDFTGLKGHTLTYTTDTNTLSNGGLAYGFNVYQVAGEVGVTKPFGDLPLHLGDYFAAFGDYANNTDANKQHVAWDAGVKMGAKKVKKLGDWQLRYQYVQIAKDAFPDALTEDDRYGGMTDVKSHELTFVFGLMKNVSFDMHYFNADRYKAAKDRQQVVQADILLKF